MDDVFVISLESDAYKWLRKCSVVEGIHGAADCAVAPAADDAECEQLAAAARFPKGLDPQGSLYGNSGNHVIAVYHHTPLIMLLACC